MIPTSIELVWSILVIFFRTANMTPRNFFIFLCLFLFINFIPQVKTAGAKCAERCEQSKMRHHDTGIKNRAMKPAHVFKTLTVRRMYECHVKCFKETCRCQAFQMAQNRCELLEEDRLSTPEDYEHEDGYVYFDMDREYVQQVRVTC